MSFRGMLFSLLLVFALLAAPASFAAEQANSVRLWQAFTNWLVSSLGLGDQLEALDLFLPGGRPQGDSNEVATSSFRAASHKVLRLKEATSSCRAADRPPTP